VHYAIFYKKPVAKELRKITPVDRAAIIKKIQSLSDDPFPVGAVLLQGAARWYRVRSGDYRIIYEVQQQKVVVLIIKVGHRREVYRAS